MKAMRILQRYFAYKAISSRNLCHTEAGGGDASNELETPVSLAASLMQIDCQRLQATQLMAHGAVYIWSDLYLISVRLSLPKEGRKNAVSPRRLHAHTRERFPGAASRPPGTCTRDTCRIDILIPAETRSDKLVSPQWDIGVKDQAKVIITVDMKVTCQGSYHA